MIGIGESSVSGVGLSRGDETVTAVTARVLTMGPIVNSAVAGAVEIDPELANNFSSATLIGLNPATVVSKRSFLAR